MVYSGSEPSKLPPPKYGGKPDPQYRQLSPESRVRLCAEFKDQGDGTFSVDRVSVNKIMADNGLAALGTDHELAYMEETCRHYAAARESDRSEPGSQHAPQLVGSRPSGVSDVGWENWDMMSQAEQQQVCAAIRSVTNVEIQSMGMAVDAGADIGTRVPEPPESTEIRILCNVPAPDYRAMQAQWEADQTRARTDEFDRLYRQLNPEARADVCSQFIDAGVGRFRYNPDAISRILANSGVRAMTNKDDFRSLEETYRFHASIR